MVRWDKDGRQKLLRERSWPLNDSGEVTPEMKDNLMAGYQDYAQWVLGREWVRNQQYQSRVRPPGSVNLASPLSTIYEGSSPSNPEDSPFGEELDLEDESEDDLEYDSGEGDEGNPEGPLTGVSAVSGVETTSSPKDFH